MYAYIVDRRMRELYMCAMMLSLSLSLSLSLRREDSSNVQFQYLTIFYFILQQQLAKIAPNLPQ